MSIVVEFLKKIIFCHFAVSDFCVQKSQANSNKCTLSTVLHKPTFPDPPGCRFCLSNPVLVWVFSPGRFVINPFNPPSGKRAAAKYTSGRKNTATKGERREKWKRKQKRERTGSPFAGQKKEVSDLLLFSLFFLTADRPLPRPIYSH